ncbi:MAG: hypothetical protein IJ454_03515, partial [Clostridia bacterium]|nr:hypothetical protein [Clostridia bacterium]
YVELSKGKVYKNGEEINLSEATAKASGINLPDVGGHEAEIHYFVDCVANGVKPEIITPQEAQDTIKLVESLLENCTEI